MYNITNIYIFYIYIYTVEYIKISNLYIINFFNTCDTADDLIIMID